ncbi:hypothetical protein ACFYUD_03775 [Nocardia tengchongensis]|uniref:hypothetical protein n=1 Tax=Nocardia tengchongensis TaxID=2055889 RepID=UPI0036A008BC
MSQLAGQQDWELISPHRLDDSGMRAALPVGVGESLLGFGDRGMLASIELTSRQLTRSTVSARLCERYPVQGDAWWPFIGRIGVLGWMAASAVTSDKHRAYLLAFLEVWTNTVFVDPAARLRTGLVTFTRLVAADEHGAAVALHAAGGRGTIARFIDCRAGEQDPPSLGPVEKFTPLAMGWGDAGQLRSLVALVGERGPVPWDPRAVAELASRTGLSRAAAVLVLAGYPGTGTVADIGYHFDTARRKALGVTLTELRDASDTLKECATRDPAYVPALFVDVLPADPADLWAPDAMVSVATRLAEAWNRRHRTRVVIPEDTLAAARKIGSELTDKALGSPSVERLLAAVAAPDAVPALTQLPDLRMERYESEWRAEWTAGYLITSDNALFGKYRDFEGMWPKLIHTCRWAYANLAAGDPVRAGVPRTIELLRAQMLQPGLLLDLGWLDTSAITATGQRTIAGAQVNPEYTYDDGLTLAKRSGDREWTVAIRPAEYRRDDRTERLRSATGGHWSGGTLWTIDWLFGPECDRMVARAADRDTPAGSFEADPRSSVPDLVAEVGRTLELDEDAATLYLQLAMLASPTDRNIRRWNGWKPARHTKAEAILAERGLVIRDKRARAGRGVFLPGAWIDKPGLEHYKWELHGLHAGRDGKQARGLELPWTSLATLFEQAWHHVQSVRAESVTGGRTSERVRATVVQGWEKVTQIPLDHRGRLLRVLPSGGTERAIDSGRILAALVLTSRQLTTPVPSAKLAKSYPAGSECWGEFIGRIGAVALRAVSPFTREEEREYLLAFLRTWSQTLFADRTATLRTGTVLTTNLVVADEHGAAVVIGNPEYESERRLFLDGRTGDEQPPALGDIEEMTPVRMAWGDAEQLRALIALIERPGPVPWDDRAAIELACRTGLSDAAATLILTGYLGMATAHTNAGRLMDPTQRKVLDHNLTRLERAGKELADFYPVERRGYVAALLADVLPADPADLWEPDGSLRLAIRVADAWIARHGRRVAVPDATVVAVESGLTEPAYSSDGSAKLCAMVAAPDTVAAFSSTFDVRVERVHYSWRPDRLDYELTATGSEPFHDLNKNWVRLIELCRWAATELPAGDPVRAGIPRTLELLRVQLRQPGLILSLSDTSAESIAELRTRNTTMPVDDPSADSYDDGLTVAKDTGRGEYWWLYFRPAHYCADSRSQDLRTAARRYQFALDHLDWLFSTDGDRLMHTG